MLSDLCADEIESRSSDHAPDEQKFTLGRVGGKHAGSRPALPRPLLPAARAGVDAFTANTRSHRMPTVLRARVSSCSAAVTGATDMGPVDRLAKHALAVQSHG